MLGHELAAGATGAGGAPLAEEQRVRVFVKFSKPGAAMKAHTALTHAHRALHFECRGAPVV